MSRPRGLFILDNDAFDLIYGRSTFDAIAQRVELVAAPQTRISIAANRHLLASTQLIFSGWGMPLVDDAFLQDAPQLQAIFYGAGAIGYWCTQAVWDRNIVVTSANDANAIPVAEYTLATILFSLKHGWSLARRTREERLFPDRNGAPGAYQSTVGLVSMGMIARKLREMLRGFDLNVIVYDPFLSADAATELNVRLVSLDELFSQADVVSVHTPMLPETAGMIRGAHIASMKKGATLINTSRGEVIQENQMLEVLGRRQDLQAVLDTVVDEPPKPDSPLYTLPNVVLTPHIAGSVGQECRRMGRYMLDDLDLFLSGKPMRHRITEHQIANSVHRPLVKVLRKPALARSGSLRTNPI